MRPFGLTEAGYAKQRKELQSELHIRMKSQLDYIWHQNWVRNRSAIGSESEPGFDQNKDQNQLWIDVQTCIEVESYFDKIWSPDLTTIGMKMILGNHFEMDPERNAKPIPKLIQKLIQKDVSSAPESEWDSELDSELGRNRGRNCTRLGFRIEATYRTFNSCLTIALPWMDLLWTCVAPIFIK